MYRVVNGENSWYSRETCFTEQISKYIENNRSQVLTVVIMMWYVCMLSHVQLCNSMDCSPPGSSVHGISQARILDYAAVSFSRGSSQPRDQAHVSCISCIGRQILYHCTPWEALLTNRKGIYNHGKGEGPFLSWKESEVYWSWCQHYELMVL